ncbi:MAG: lipoprotein-releasing system ATP-binding protein LolD [Spirochaetae bacterium HGW-Spirochaetae-8]|jgi:putative ABC transport system ATP-binding protein|nr:MAG: lipoprotein-releasing system ATP-binding protein LolD [Spirochaetae bacterium HGW-Spirochaetae-8]
MIKVEQVVRDYQAGETVVKALKGVSLEIGDGEFVSIAGPSGSGKTTLLNLIGCIDALDSGEILIDGVKVTSMDKKEKTTYRRNNLGFIFQTYNLIPVLSAYENVSFVLSILNLPEEEIKQRTMAILREVGLQGMEDRRPSRLSGGQQQRIAIARALVKNPRIVLADEPTANLDSKTGQEILKLMKAMNEKYHTTFIFSTHDQMVMDFADRLILLHDGNIISDERRSV